MDSAYDAKSIRDFITDNGRIPIIDPNKRRKSTTGSFSPREAKVQDQFDRRAIQLPPEGLGDTSEDRGEKVTHCLMTGVLCLAVIKILQYCIPPGIRETS